jgi:hypothetical protein
MIRNVGTRDRLYRGLAALPLLACSFLAPLPLGARLLTMAAPAIYLLFTAFAGLCACYALVGKSTCAVPRR